MLLRGGQRRSLLTRIGLPLPTEAGIAVTGLNETQNEKSNTQKKTGDTMLQTEKTENIATITINCPEKHNALNREMIRQIPALLAELQRDDAVRLVRVTGAGDKAFCSGVQLDELIRFSGTEDARNYALELDAMFDAVFRFPKPIIAAINGYALGGGFALALACDLRVASDNTRIGFPAVRIGAILPIGCTLQLVEQIGLGRTKDLLLTGRLIDAADALEFGLVEHLCKADELQTKTTGLSRQILEGGDLALRFSKLVTNHAVQIEIERYRQSNADNFAYLSTTQDWRERIELFVKGK